MHKEAYVRERFLYQCLPVMSNHMNSGDLGSIYARFLGLMNNFCIVRPQPSVLQLKRPSDMTSMPSAEVYSGDLGLYLG